MRKEKKILLVLMAMGAVLMSIPFLVPHCGWVSLFALVPLLCMDYIARENGIRRFWMWHYATFVLWNAITTFWVSNATIGGGIFAVLANALQMSVIFGLFRLSRKKFSGVLPYVFLAAMWIAWEKWYLLSAQISWPWLVLGNGFARTLSLCQFYEYTGTLGGSLWIWLSNLAIFGTMVSIAEGRWSDLWNPKQRIAAIAGLVLVVSAPAIWSAVIWNTYQEQSEGELEVAIAQPNFDPYQKFQALTQEQQNAILLDVFDNAIADRKNDTLSAQKPLLLLAPETFTSDISIGELQTSPTWNRFANYIGNYPGANILFGASSHEFIFQDGRPSWTARRYRDGVWYQSRNTALLLDATGRTDLYHKTKLVVGVESTPYPALFSRIDDVLGGVMGRCIGQDEVNVLNVRTYDQNGNVASNIPVGCAICYESIYGEFCADYVKKGAKALAVITNDAWWGNTPGYVQHCSYSSLRAIELRRDIARCANTGISCFIDQKGQLHQPTEYWVKAHIRGNVNLNSKITFFASHGDIAGRICTFVFFLMLLALLVRFFVREPNRH